jgi:hypothetical protein
MFDVPLRDNYGMYQYISQSSHSSVPRLVYCHYFVSHGYRGYCKYRLSALAIFAAKTSSLGRVGGADLKTTFNLYLI